MEEGFYLFEWNLLVVEIVHYSWGGIERGVSGVNVILLKRLHHARQIEGE